MSKFKLTFVGVGSAFSKIHNNNNVLIEIDSKKYLLDCGIKTPQALHNMGIELKDIEGVIVSHIHADHTGGLEELGFMGKFVLNKKFKLFISDDLVDPLWNNSLSGGMEDDTDGKRSLGDYFDISLFNDLDKFEVSGLSILPIKTVHVNKDKPSYSFIFNNKVFFSADILFEEELLLTLDSMETIFHDVQFFKGGVHCSLDELETLPENIREKIKLMHYSDNFKDFKDRAEKSKMTFVNQGEIFNF